jgi:hypothetical protein
MQRFSGGRSPQEPASFDQAGASPSPVVNNENDSHYIHFLQECKRSWRSI